MIFDKRNTSLWVYCLTFLLFLFVFPAFFSASKVSAEVTEIESNLRWGLFKISDTDEITASKELGKIGTYDSPGANYYYRVYTQFDISSLLGKTIMGIGFKVFNSGNAGEINFLWYFPQQLRSSYDDTTIEELDFPRGSNPPVQWIPMEYQRGEFLDIS